MSTPDDTPDISSREVELAEEAREVRTAIRMLSSRVEALSVDLKQVNALAVQQQEIDRRSSEAIFEAAKAMGEARALETRLGTQEEEHRRRWEEESTRKLQLQRRVRKQTIAASIGVLVTSLVASGIAIGVVYHESKKGDERSVQECQTRVASSKKAVTNLEKLLTSSQVASGDQGLRAFIMTSRDNAARTAALSCTKDGK